MEPFPIEALNNVDEMSKYLKESDIDETSIEILKDDYMKLSTDTLFCTVCNSNINGGLKELSLHFRHRHGLLTTKLQQKGFICGQDGCQRSFHLFSSFARHIKNQHLSEGCDKTPLMVDRQSDIQNAESFAFAEIDRILLPKKQSAAKKEKFDVSTAAAQMIADLRSNCSFTGSAVTKIINTFEDFLTDLCSHFISEAKSVFNSLGVDSNVPEVESFLNELDIDSPFKEMKSINGQMKALKTYSNYIQPVEKLLGSRRDQLIDSETGENKIKIVRETFQYVPIVDTLKSILSNSYVRNYVEKETSSSDSILRNFRDAESFKNNEFFKKFPQALRLQVYYDDVVVNNPLGSKVQPHRLGAFYYTVQNIPPEYNSMLGAIHVLAICHTADIEKYGMKKILNQFLRDLHKLESDDGVTITLNGTPYTLRASIACVCADGMAAHQLFGFLSPAARHFCRLCMISREQLHQDPSQDYEKRTEMLYNQQVSQVALHQATETETGVRENSVLHMSKYFHCSKNYVFDPMHDLLEGVCQMELKLVLNYYAYEKKYIDLTLFNGRIHSFRYGAPESKNKPSSNFTMSNIRKITDHSLHQNAMQTWCLMRTFPFLIGDKVPDDDDKHLQLILLLNRILEIVLSPKVTVSILAYLDELIKEHEDLFKELFPETNFINKHHHLTHYSECIKMSGPLRNLWCMRFEGKHHIFKKHAIVCSNFRNLPKTMTRLCQISQCSFWGAKDQLPLRLQCPKGSMKYVKDASSRASLLELGFVDNDMVFVTGQLNLYGTDYRGGYFLSVDSGINNGGDPVFGKIKEIVILDNQQTYFYCHLWQTVGLDSRTNSYHVVPDKKYRLICYEKIPDFKPMTLWHDYKIKESFLCLRHILI